MARAAAVALAVAALVAAAAPAASAGADPLAKFVNLTADIKAAVNNGGSPKSRILNGTKPSTAILDALNAKRTVIQAAVKASVASHVGASPKAVAALAALSNATAVKEAALLAALNKTEAAVEDAQAVLLAKLNGTKLASVVDFAFNKTKDKLERAAGDVSYFARLKQSKLRSLAPPPNLAPWQFAVAGGALTSGIFGGPYEVNQTTNGQVAPVAADGGATEYGLRVVPGGRAGGAAPADRDVPEASVEDADVSDASPPVVRGKPTIQAIMARQRMAAAVAADAAAAAASGGASADAMDDADAELAAWLAARPADGAPADEVAAWVDRLPDSALDDGVEDDGNAGAAAPDAAAADAAPFDGAADAGAFYAVYGQASSESEEKVVGVPDYVTGPGVAIPDIDAADVDDQKKYVALRALGVKRQLALEAVGATEGASFKAAFAYILHTLKYGSGVDLIYQGAAAVPQGIGVQPARKRSLLEAAADTGRRLLASPSAPVLAWAGDDTVTSQTYNGFVVEPPDQGLCAGGGWVIEATNVVISVRPQSNPATIAANFPKSLKNFFGGVTGDGYGDPRCVFIPAYNVFIVTAYRVNGANSWVAMAVSPPVTTAAPNVGTWKVYNIDSRGIGVLSACTVSTPCFGDYPMLGYNDNSVWLSTNAFYDVGSTSYFAGVQLWGVSLAAVASQANSPYIWTAGRNDIFTLHPMSGQTTTGDVMFFLATYDSTRFYTLTVSTTSRLASSLAPVVGTPELIVTGISIASPPTVYQANGVQVDQGDNRILSVAFANGRLYATLNTAATWSGVTRNSIAYYIIATPNPCAAWQMVYTGIYGWQGFHAYGAAIAPSNANPASAGFVGFITGASFIPFGSVFGRITVGTGVTYANAVNLAPYGQYLTGFTVPIRTGDYSQACVDPATGQFWGASEQGQVARVTGSNNWGTIIWNCLL